MRQAEMWEARKNIVGEFKDDLLCRVFVQAENFS